MSVETIITRAETALLDLVAAKPFHTIAMSEIATNAGVSLADLRRAYDGPFDVLSGFARRIDVGVLEAGEPAEAEASAKDRLFDTLMRRFDLLAPHRAGLRGLRRSARRDPVLAAHLVRLVIGSQAWILEAAGISAAGPKGAAKAVALACAVARIAPIFVDEEDAGLPKTMAALDAALDRLGRLATRVSKVEAVVSRIARRRGAGCRPRSEPAMDEAIDPAI